jgi:hypothetical protein
VVPVAASVKTKLGRGGGDESPSEIRRSTFSGYVSGNAGFPHADKCHDLCGRASGTKHSGHFFHIRIHMPKKMFVSHT